MKNANIVQISKLLSLVLRHNPARLGITLDEQGWTSVDFLLEQLQKNGKKVDLQTLELVVETNDKKRFAFNTDKTKIRASQGHSVKIDVGYSPTTPPEMLYHGTASRFVNSIRKEGLHSGNRQHVHLSVDVATATNVGTRHGVPVILMIAAAKMCQAGYHFFISDNGVWLTEKVPLEYIEFPDNA